LEELGQLLETVDKGLGYYRSRTLTLAGFRGVLETELQRHQNSVQSYAESIPEPKSGRPSPESN
jgi:hypothetical protein